MNITKTFLREISGVALKLYWRKIKDVGNSSGGAVLGYGICRWDR
jgi:hypothetical protein